MKKQLYIIIITLFIFSVTGLIAEDLVGDRPDATESATAVPLGSWQFEMGYTFTTSGDLKNHSLGELLIRYAPIDNLELRLGVNSFQVAKFNGISNSGWEDFSIGFKLALIQDKVAILAGISLPTGAEVFRADSAEPSVILALAHDLSENLSVGVNLGYASLSGEPDRTDEFYASVALGTGFTDKLGFFIEYFGFFYKESDGGSRHFSDMGLTYLVSPRFQLDVRAGILLNKGDGDGEFFFGFGAIFRVDRK